MNTSRKPIPLHTLLPIVPLAYTLNVHEQPWNRVQEVESPESAREPQSAPLSARSLSALTESDSNFSELSSTLPRAVNSIPRVVHAELADPAPDSVRPLRSLPPSATRAAETQHARLLSADRVYLVNSTTERVLLLATSSTDVLGDAFHDVNVT